MGMDNLIGIRTNNFVMIASDMNVGSSILSIKSDEDKFRSIFGQVSFAHCGNFAKGSNLARLLNEEIKLNHFNSLMPITATTSAYIAQERIHTAVRRAPYETNVLIMDKKNNLIAIDQYGAMTSDNYICMGYFRLFLYGLLDSEYKENMNSEQALQLLQKCINVMKSKFLINYMRYKVRIFEGGEERSPEMSPQ